MAIDILIGSESLDLLRSAEHNIKTRSTTASNLQSSTQPTSVNIQIEAGTKALQESLEITAGQLIDILI